MANTEALFSALSTPTYRLLTSIAAIPASRASTGAPELGAISRLPDGAELTFCGEGFNESTLKVRCEGQFYFVFAQDIAPAEPVLEESSDQNGTPRKPSKSELVKQLTASQVA